MQNCNFLVEYLIKIKHGTIVRSNCPDNFMCQCWNPMQIQELVNKNVLVSINIHLSFSVVLILWKEWNLCFFNVISFGRALVSWHLSSACRPLRLSKASDLYCPWCCSLMCKDVYLSYIHNKECIIQRYFTQLQCWHYWTYIH